MANLIGNSADLTIGANAEGANLTSGIEEFNATIAENEAKENKDSGVLSSFIAVGSTKDNEFFNDETQKEPGWYNYDPEPMEIAAEVTNGFGEKNLENLTSSVDFVLDSTNSIINGVASYLSDTNYIQETHENIAKGTTWAVNGVSDYFSEWGEKPEKPLVDIASLGINALIGANDAYEKANENFQKNLEAGDYRAIGASGADGIANIASAGAGVAAAAILPSAKILGNIASDKPDLIISDRKKNIDKEVSTFLTNLTNERKADAQNPKIQAQMKKYGMSFKEYDLMEKGYASDFLGIANNRKELDKVINKKLAGKEGTIIIDRGVDKNGLLGDLAKIGDENNQNFYLFRFVNNRNEYGDKYTGSEAEYRLNNLNKMLKNENLKNIIGAESDKGKVLNLNEEINYLTKILQNFDGRGLPETQTKSSLILATFDSKIENSSSSWPYYIKAQSQLGRFYGNSFRDNVMIPKPIWTNSAYPDRFFTKNLEPFRQNSSILHSYLLDENTVKHARKSMNANNWGNMRKEYIEKLSANNDIYLFSGVGSVGLGATALAMSGGQTNLLADDAPISVFNMNSKDELNFTGWKMGDKLDTSILSDNLFAPKFKTETSFKANAKQAQNNIFSEIEMNETEFSPLFAPNLESLGIDLYSPQYNDFDENISTQNLDDIGIKW